MTWHLASQKTWRLLPHLVAALAALPLAAAADEEEKVIVWRRLRNDFHDKTIPDNVIEDIVRKSPPAAITLRPGETLSARLQSAFNVSQSWTPSMYQSLVGRVVELNGLQSPDAIAAGTSIKIPLVP